MLWYMPRSPLRTEKLSHRMPSAEESHLTKSITYYQGSPNDRIQLLALIEEKECWLAWGGSQEGGGVEGSWAHFLPQTHQGYNYVWCNSTWQPREQISHSLRHKEDATYRRGRAEIQLGTKSVWPQVNGILQVQRCCLRNKGIKLHIGQPWPWRLAREQAPT